MFGVRATSAVLTCAALIWGGGCASSDRAGHGARGAAGSGGEVVVIGDWNDVEAAAIAAMDGNETTIVGQSASDREQVFELLTIMDGRGKLVARREGAGADLIPIHLTCTLGLFGEPAREKAVLAAAARRLRELAGVEYAPRR